MKMQHSNIMKFKNMQVYKKATTSTKCKNGMALLGHRTLQCTHHIYAIILAQNNTSNFTQYYPLALALWVNSTYIQQLYKNRLRQKQLCMHVA